MAGNLTLFDKIILGGITIFALYLGVGMIFINFPWGILGTGFVFCGWSGVTRLYTFTFVEDRPIYSGTPRHREPEVAPQRVKEESEEVPFDDPRWIIPIESELEPIPASEGNRILSAALRTVSESRVIMGPTPAGGEICEVGTGKKDKGQSEDQEWADMVRAL